MTHSRPAFAQAGESRSSEKDSRSGELPSPRRELDTYTTAAFVHYHLGKTPLAWARHSLAQNWVGRLSDPSRKKSGRASAHLAWVRQARLGEIIRSRHCFPATTIHTKPKITYKSIPRIQNIISTIES